MGFSSVQLEGPSASCFPRLPTALHSAISKDGLWQNSLGSKPCGSYRQQWRAKERLDYMVFENTVRERTRRILFSVTSWWWNLCVHPKEHTYFWGYLEPTAQSIKKNQLHSQCQAWKSIKEKVRVFFFHQRKSLPFLELSFLFPHPSIHFLSPACQ